MSDLASLIFYFVSFLLSFLFYCLYNRSKKKSSRILFFVIAFSIPMVIGGFRYKVGTDFNTYVGLFNIYKNYNIKLQIFSSKIEAGFIIVAIFAKYFGAETAMFFIFNTLTLLFTFCGINNLNKETRPIAYLCYLYLYFTSSFNGIRQMLSVSIVFWGFKFVTNKKFIKYFICILLAETIHTTALLCLPIYFICNIKNKKIKYIIMLIFFILCINYQNLLKFITRFSFFSKYSQYETYNSGHSFNNYNFILTVIILIYIKIFYKKLIKYSQDIECYYIIFIVGVILNFTGFISPDVKRISTYFKIVEITILPQILCVTSNSKKRIFNMCFILCYIMGSFIIYTYILKQGNVIPYRFIS